jgi:hypothetical protein
MSFSDYLAKRRITDNPSGAFTREAREDPGMAVIESWPQLQAYLFRRHGTKVANVIDAAEPVWKGYRAHVLKTRRAR